MMRPQGVTKKHSSLKKGKAKNDDTMPIFHSDFGDMSDPLAYKKNQNDIASN